MVTANELKNIKPIPGQSEAYTIEQYILAAAKEGKNNVWWYKQLSAGMKILLKESGYKINEQWDRNDYLVNISW